MHLISVNWDFFSTYLQVFYLFTLSEVFICFEKIVSEWMEVGILSGIQKKAVFYYINFKNGFQNQALRINCLNLFPFKLWKVKP